MLDSVKAIAADTAGVFRQIVDAGRIGARGNIAIIGEPGDGILLARRFQNMDESDNIDGRPVRDSLPDFAGEVFHVLLDEYNAPYSHFLSFEADTLSRSGLDSLRELAVRNAVYAWQDGAKILVFTSPLQAEYGLFDVDTLRKMAGASTVILSPLVSMYTEALDAGATRLAVWTSREKRHSGVYAKVFSRMAPAGASVEVITPDAALDVRTELRSLLRQYLSRAEALDAILIDDYSVNLLPLSYELTLIRHCATEEDRAFNGLLSPGFHFITPGPSVTQAVGRVLREEKLFTHRIAHPEVRYYQSVESEEGGMTVMEVGARYVQEAYVQDFN